jgi:hypothetical protein
MSLLLQSLLGAKVDGSGSSLHADGRRIRDQDENFPIGKGGRAVYETEVEVTMKVEAESWGVGDGRWLVVTIFYWSWKRRCQSYRRQRAAASS